jgi:Xaa-Pro aminopeptidase
MLRASGTLAISAVLLFSASAGALERQAGSDYRARRQALAAKATNGLVLLFAPAEAEGPNDLYGYRPDDNFFYLTGWSEPGAALLVSPEVPAVSGAGFRPYREVLFLPERNRSQEKWTGPKLGPDNPQAAEIAGVDNVDSLDHLSAELARLLVPPTTVVYTDTPAQGQTSNSATMLPYLRAANAFPIRSSFADVRPMLSLLRTFKDAGEIARLRKATDASIAAQLAAMRALKPGMNEREISALLQYEWGKRGCERPAYAPIVGAGFRSTVLHYSDDSHLIDPGDVVVIDAAGEYSMYASDLTRTLPASGRFTARQREIYAVVLGAQQAAISAFVSGKSHLQRGQPDSLYQVAYDYINTHAKDLHDQPLGQYFIHGLGHYLGLNVHDPGDYSVPLSPGAAFTLEPGIYLPEESLGVRIEDDFYVDGSGNLIDLSQALPRAADEVERVMSGR